MDDESQFEKRQSILGSVAVGPVAPGKYRKLTVELLPQFNGTSSKPLVLVLEDNVYEELPLTVICVSNVSLV